MGFFLSMEALCLNPTRTGLKSRCRTVFSKQSICGRLWMLIMWLISRAGSCIQANLATVSTLPGLTGPLQKHGRKSQRIKSYVKVSLIYADYIISSMLCNSAGSLLQHSKYTHTPGECVRQINQNLRTETGLKTGTTLNMCCILNNDTAQ